MVACGLSKYTFHCIFIPHCFLLPFLGAVIWGECSSIYEELRPQKALCSTFWGIKVRDSPFGEGYTHTTRHFPVNMPEPGATEVKVRLKVKWLLSLDRMQKLRVANGNCTSYTCIRSSQQKKLQDESDELAPKKSKPEKLKSQLRD